MPNAQIPPGSAVAIIGAGVVGMASACALNRKGYEVTVFDPYYPGEGGSSKANAGHIGASDIFPLSTPGICLLYTSPSPRDATRSRIGA